MAFDKINPSAAANAYASMQKAVSTAGGDDGDASGTGSAGGAGSGSGGGMSFGSMLKSAASDAITTMKSGEKASAAAVSGKAELSDVVQAVTNAELTLQTVVAVRDRMLGSYQAIMNMPI